MTSLTGFMNKAEKTGTDCKERQKIGLGILCTSIDVIGVFRAVIVAREALLEPGGVTGVGSGVLGGRTPAQNAKRLAANSAIEWFLPARTHGKPRTPFGRRTSALATTRKDVKTSQGATLNKALKTYPLKLLNTRANDKHWHFEYCPLRESKSIISRTAKRFRRSGFDAMRLRN